MGHPSLESNGDAKSKKGLSSLFSVSCGASVFMALYVGMAALNLTRLMFPLSVVDVSVYPDGSFIKPLWSKDSEIHLKLYLSSRKQFSRSFLLDSEFSGEQQQITQGKDATSETNFVALLLSEKITSPAFSKSFLLTTLPCQASFNSSCEMADASYTSAIKWIDHAEHVLSASEGGIFSAIAAAGHGIESTSFLLTIYGSFVKQIRKLASLSVLTARNTTLEQQTNSKRQERTTIRVSPNSEIWKSLIASNSTSSSVYVHALLVRTDKGFTWPPTTPDLVTQALQKASSSHSLLLGEVNMIKLDKPHHINKPGRILFHDVYYLWQKYILMRTVGEPPWNMAYSKPSQYADYHRMVELKQNGSGYPYWKPEVAIKLVNEEDSYPSDLAHLSGMPVVRVPRTAQHTTGMAFAPVLHVDEIGLTSEKYIPVNETLTSLPLRILFDRSDIAHQSSANTATAGGMSPARWRLLSHLSDAIEAQKQLGFQQEDIDDVRRLIADTNVTLLAITVIFSALHMLFEFLTFKNDVSFWRSNNDLTGLSVRSLFLDMIGQIIILLFLIEKDSSLLMTVPSGIGCLIALWKCRRAAGLTFVKITRSDRKTTWWNWLPSLAGYELRAVRLERASMRSDNNTKENSQTDRESRRRHLEQVTHEADVLATKTLGSVLLPIVLCYTLYTFLWEEHTGWYSWLVTSASSAVYALGFVLMTPQLFLNWKLKSVAHLPWRVLIYKSLNTFIDDLFSFIIRMPTMARISCFRDDVVFFIYLYQRWLYPTDSTRPIEGGGISVQADEPQVDKEKKEQ